MKKVLSLIASALLATSAFAGQYTNENYIQKWGRLKLVGNQLSSENGEAIQLKGWSTFGNYDTNCMRSAEDIGQMKEWGANVVRLAQYINNTWSNFSEDKFKGYIDACANYGMYIVADWHILQTNECGNCGNPNNFKNDGAFNTSAKTFFTTIAKYVQQKGYKHVIYELCNEPSDNVSWGEIKSYAEEMIRNIAQYDKGAVVIVGTRAWDQFPLEAAENPIQTSDAHVLYAFHLYANEDYHKTVYNSQFKPAVNKIPIFVSEWGLSSAQPEKRSDYNDVNESFGREFWNAMGGQLGQKVSWCNWSYGSKQEGASTFQGSCSTSSLSPSGKIVIDMLGGNPDDKVKVGECFGGGDGYHFTSSIKEKMFEVTSFNNGGEGVAYHDANDTDEEEGEEPPTELKKPGCQAATAAGYCDYRADETCVDITGCNGGVDGVGEGYNIGWVSEGEWLRYCINVEDPGYYYIEAVGNPTTMGNPMSISLVGVGDNIMADIDASSNTEMAELSGIGIYFQDLPDAYYDPSQPDDANWMHWGWIKPSNAAGNKTSNHGICLKEAGEYTLELSFPEGFGDLGSLRFTYAKPYTGEGYSKTVEVENATSAVNVTIFPNPATDVISTNAEVSKLEVVDLTGKVVAESDKNNVNVANLAVGSYIVKAYTNEFGIITKQIIKK